MQITLNIAQNYFLNLLGKFHLDINWPRQMIRELFSIQSVQFPSHKRLDSRNFVSDQLLVLEVEQLVKVLSLGQLRNSRT